MRPYYLRKNFCGYYVVAFTNKETGLRTNYKSTRTKNYDEALQIAMKWYMQGAPEKNKRKPEYKSVFDFENLLDRISSDEAKTLFEMLCSKYGFMQTSQSVPAVQNFTMRLVERSKT